MIKLIIFTLGYSVAVLIAASPWGIGHAYYGAIEECEAKLIGNQACVISARPKREIAGK